MLFVAFADDTGRLRFLWMLGRHLLTKLPAISSFQIQAGHTWPRIRHTAQTTFVETWRKGIVLWSAVSYVNQSFVPALYQTVLNDAVAFFWTMYMAVQVKAKGKGNKRQDEQADIGDTKGEGERQAEEDEKEPPIFSGNINMDQQKPGPMDRFLTRKGKKTVKVDKNCNGA